VDEDRALLVVERLFDQRNLLGCQFATPAQDSPRAFANDAQAPPLTLGVAPDAYRRDRWLGCWFLDLDGFGNGVIATFLDLEREHQRPARC
jgi:hypothetical protein